MNYVCMYSHIAFTRNFLMDELANEAYLERSWLTYRVANTEILIRCSNIG